MIRVFAPVFALFVLFTTGPVLAAGFQPVTMPDPSDKPIEAAIWYPSGAPLKEEALNLFKQNVAKDGAISGGPYPLIVISHGTGGSASTYYDTAIALADAGFVVVAITHTGDNYRDRSYSFTLKNFTERSRHVKLAIDYMLSVWPEHDRIDPARIGIYGHSAGGFTALVVAGGTPDIGLMSSFCPQHPETWDCQRVGQRPKPSEISTAESPSFVHDPRVKVAVIAAPAVGYAFSSQSLASVKVPIQLWAAEDDQVTVARWNSDIVRAALPTQPDYRLAASASHFAFLSPCSDALASRVPEICQEAAGFDRSVFHQEFNRAVAVFFASHLR